MDSLVEAADFVQMAVKHQEIRISAPEGIEFVMVELIRWASELFANKTLSKGKQVSGVRK